MRRKKLAEHREPQDSDFGHDGIVRKRFSSAMEEPSIEEQRMKTVELPPNPAVVMLALSRIRNMGKDES